MKADRLKHLGSQQRPDPLPLRNPCRPFRRALLCPLGHLAKPDLMLHGIPVDSNGEFRHWARTQRIDIVLPELGHSNGNRLIEAFRVHIDAMKNAVRIGEGHVAAGTGHETDYSVRFALYSPTVFNPRPYVSSIIDGHGLDSARLCEF